jgi:glycosyltransferase involved in cell wall biosynthesis
MALRLPVVASDTAGNAELVIANKTGLLARRNDPADLAGKIVYLLDTPSFAREMGNNAYQRVTTYFSLAATSDRIHEVYRSLLKS